LKDREPLDDDDEFYVQDLIGMRVVMHSTKAAVGKVVDIYSGTGVLFAHS
jgi:16S rRNA processing protein RimM